MKIKLLLYAMILGLIVSSTPTFPMDKGDGASAVNDRADQAKAKKVKKEGISSLTIARGIAYTSFAAALTGLALVHFKTAPSVRPVLFLGGLLGSLFGGSYLAYKEMREQDPTKTSGARKAVAFAIPILAAGFCGIMGYGISQIRSLPNGGRQPSDAVDLAVALNLKPQQPDLNVKDVK